MASGVSNSASPSPARTATTNWLPDLGSVDFVKTYHLLCIFFFGKNKIKEECEKIEIYCISHDRVLILPDNKMLLFDIASFLLGGVGVACAAWTLRKTLSAD
jgi:hypothetical protein